MEYVSFISDFFSIMIKNNISRIMRKFDFGSLVFHPSGLLGEIVPFVFLVVFRFYVRPAALRGFNCRFAYQTFGVRLGARTCTCATCGILVPRTFAEESKIHI